MTHIPFITALLASMLHVLSGPDHLAAVTPIAISSDKKPWIIGFLWGFGHVLGMLLIGVLFYFFKDLIPIEKISEYSEQLVALVLIGVGLVSFYRIFKENKKQNYPHFHEKEIHIHSHNDQNLHSHTKIVKQNNKSSFGIGFLHGLAGVAHFFLLSPILSFTSKTDSYTYLIGFGLGTIIAMTAYAALIGKISSVSKKTNNNLLTKGIRFSGGLFAFVIGIYWFYLTQLG